MTLSGVEMGGLCGIAATAPLDVAAAALAALTCFVHVSSTCAAHDCMDPV